MAAQFNGSAVFGGGPLAFSEEAVAHALVSTFTIAGAGGGALTLGLRDVEVSVSGRFAASSLAALNTLRSGLRSLVTDPLTTGTLEDDLGGTWADMSLIRYDEHGPIERGRVWSVGWSAVFHRFQESPPTWP